MINVDLGLYCVVIYMASLIWLFSSLCVCIYLLFANMFCLLESTENSKKKSSKQARIVVLFRFWYKLVNVRVYVFLHPCLG